MAFTPDLGAIRFGCGLSPGIAPAPTVEAMLEGLTGSDEIARRFPIESFDVFRQRMVESGRLQKGLKKTRGTPEGDRFRKARNLLKKDAREAKARWLGQTLLRRAYTPTGFRERLVYFWADHFTALGKAGVAKRATSPYIEEAIRPALTGTFTDLLIGAVTHPLMLHYLDQDKSMGPNSPRALAKGAAVGLNENLAREVMELHSLGVDGPYSQTDVRELAELLTGLTAQAQTGTKFRKDFVEPGAETVLGKTYPDAASPGPIRQVLTDLATHPATARHIAAKLAVHFVSDTPDPALIDHIADRFAKTGGALMPVYAALLEHPAAWGGGARNIKLPVDFIGSAFRALAVPPDRLQGFTEKDTKRHLYRWMTLMGQTWQQPLGPDGWAEEDDEWITPQGLSARVRWAMSVPQEVMGALPDPRDFVRVALGETATEDVIFAARAAESRPEAIGLVLSSPAFQRR